MKRLGLFAKSALHHKFLFQVLRRKSQKYFVLVKKETECALTSFVKSIPYHKSLS